MRWVYNDRWQRRTSTVASTTKTWESSLSRDSSRAWYMNSIQPLVVITPSSAMFSLRSLLVLAELSTGNIVMASRWQPFSTRWLHRNFCFGSLTHLRNRCQRTSGQQLCIPSNAYGMTAINVSSLVKDRSIKTHNTVDPMPPLNSAKRLPSLVVASEDPKAIAAEAMHPR